MSEQLEKSVAAGGETSGSNVCCSVYGCHSKPYDNRELLFHCFPKLGTPKKRRRVLKHNAVPSQNLPLENNNKAKTTESSNKSTRMIRRNKQKESNSVIEESIPKFVNDNPSLSIDSDDNLHQLCRHVINGSQSVYKENNLDNRRNVESAEQFQDKATPITNEDVTFFLENDNRKKFEPYLR